MYKTIFSKKNFFRDQLKLSFIRLMMLFCAIILFLLTLSNPAYNKENIKYNSMILISASDSSFQMGSENGNSDEKPVHTVSFTYNFWMDMTEVTHSDYHNVMSITYADYNKPPWGNPYGVGDNYPVYAVEWGDAALYCNARSKQAGLDTVYSYTGIQGRPGDGCFLNGLAINYSANGYRLPTEAEWEYACRAGTTTDFYWGKDFDPYPAISEDTTEVNNYAVWCGNSWNFSAESPDFGTHPVATKMPNSFGLYDMSGNVFEWINDWYSDYSSESQVDPTGSETESYHFVRGGSWGNWAIFLRSANRQFSSPDYYLYFCGFRTVLPIKSTDVGVGSGELLPDLPEQFVLLQNYPNPFNPATTIQFSLPKTATVTLTVYNTLGEVVSSLIKDQIVDAGAHSLQFDATGLSAGVYFYRLEANGFVQVKKMILLQ